MTPKPQRPKRVADPKLVSAARELRDRWLERVNAHPAAVASRAKYDVSRGIESSANVDPPPRLLAA